MIELITRDDFLYRQNISIPTDDFYNVLRSFINILEPKFGESTILWQNIYGALLAEILTRWGFCYTFNVADAVDVLNIETLV